MTSLVTLTIAGRRYGVDVVHVREAMRAPRRTPVPLAPAVVAGMVNLRGRALTCLDLRPRLELPAAPADQEPMLVVADVGGEQVGLLVDAVGDVTDVDEDRVEPPPDTLVPPLNGYIRGALPDPDGLLLVLDLEAVTA
ncbi:chemotaxis protein CheW [Georgenia subflava]|uniref:Chemotaxis protein CheW n=1 Tax=Georgenia subflava TaxID=1622177 RepID=A0A6N7EM82_9MICO|nr:chemotaxis protein CheW [Georgenia subflava]MPV39160.1 chemotaxis protein CheW [Georgenia subflava]